MNARTSIIIRGFLAVTCVISFTHATFAQTAAKTHPYNQAFENKVSTLLLDNGRISPKKLEAYIARLKQKYNEIVGSSDGQLQNNSVMIEGKRPTGAEAEKLSSKIEQSDTAVALRAAIADLEKIKTAKSANEIMNLAYNALDLEAAIRIEGKKPALLALISDGVAILSSWQIPLRSSPSEEATNLYNPQTQSLVSEADIRAAKVDVSTLNPKSSTFWQAQNDISKVNVNDAAMGRTLSIYRGADATFPADKTYYFDSVKYSDTKPKIEGYTLGADGKKTKYRLKFGREMHAESTVGALLMTLGFTADITQYQRGIKLILGKTTKDELIRQWEHYYNYDGPGYRYKVEKYIIDEGADANGNFVVFQEGIIEARPKTVGRLGGWAFDDNGHESLREVRALLILQAFVENADIKNFDNNKLLIRQNADGSVERAHMISDLGYSLGFIIGEAPDLYSSKWIERSGSSLVLKYRAIHKNPLRTKLTLADAKWTARLVAQLSREQIAQAVALGGWDTCMQKIYTEKMVMRRNQMIEATGLVNASLANGAKAQLLDEPYKGDDLKLKKVCDVASLEQHYTSDFKFDASYILGPLGKMAWKTIIDVARGVVSGQKTITLSGNQFDTRLQGVVDVIINPGQRVVERNPNPASADEQYIVKDTFEIGLRAGVSYGPYVDSVVKRIFTLTYPVRSTQEGEQNNGFIFNVLLVDDVANNRLPAKYVLKTEHYVESGVGIEMDNRSNPVAPLAIRAGVAKVRVLRTILDHRDPNNILLFRDTSRFTQDQLGLFARLAFLRIPLFKTLGQHDGNATGRAMSVSQEDIVRMPNLLKGIKLASINGDFSEVESLERNLYVQNDFSGRQTSWGLLFFKNQSERRLEYIRVTDPANPEASRTILQNRESRFHSTSFLHNSESRNIKVEVYSSSADHPENFQINVQVIGTDSNTKDKELSKNFLDFINGLGTTSQKLIPFTPELGYTTNGRWGATVTQSITNYYQAGINNVLTATDEQVINAIAESAGVTPMRLQALRSAARQSFAQTIGRGALTLQQAVKMNGMTMDEYEFARQTTKFVDNLKDARKASRMDKKVKRLSELFREAAYVKANGFFDSRILGGVNRLVGVENYYGRHLVTSPKYKELNMIEEKPLIAEVGVLQPEQQQYMMYMPQTANDLYFMFDSWF